MSDFGEPKPCKCDECGATGDGTYTFDGKIYRCRVCQRAYEDSKRPPKTAAIFPQGINDRSRSIQNG